MKYMQKKSHTVFETEKKFKCDKVDDLVTYALSMDFIKTHENLPEHDIYFTDKDGTFIDQRICLRIRQTENHCEITHKWQSKDTEALYSKLENNIKIAHDHKENAIMLLQSLWFLRYVDVKKTRNIYKKDGENMIYNIAIDHIEEAWYFVEFEILSEKALKEDQIELFFESFVHLFKDFGLQEERLPYRDIVKNLSSKK
jgi:predicted adenylyl cyclase CyaB